MAISEMNARKFIFSARAGELYDNRNVKIIPFKNAVLVHAGKPDKETGISDRSYIYSVKDSIYNRKKYKIKPMANVDIMPTADVDSMNFFSKTV